MTIKMTFYGILNAMFNGKLKLQVKLIQKHLKEKIISQKN